MHARATMLTALLVGVFIGSPFLFVWPPASAMLFVSSLLVGAIRVQMCRQGQAD
jgi:hypothetical protein